jgi:hypothetical protein
MITNSRNKDCDDAFMETNTEENNKCILYSYFISKLKYEDEKLPQKDAKEKKNKWRKTRE